MLTIHMNFGGGRFLSQIIGRFTFVCTSIVDCGIFDGQCAVRLYSNTVCPEKEAVIKIPRNSGLRFACEKLTNLIAQRKHPINSNRNCNSPVDTQCSTIFSSGETVTSEGFRIIFGFLDRSSSLFLDIKFD